MLNALPPVLKWAGLKVESKLTDLNCNLAVALPLKKL
jgi:hypothetical protein